MDEKSANAHPRSRLPAGGRRHEPARNTGEFQFDAAGHLLAVQTSQRDLVCPHKVCSADQLSQPWTPVPAQGDNQGD